MSRREEVERLQKKWLSAYAPSTQRELFRRAVTIALELDDEVERLREALTLIAEGRWNVAVDRYAHKTVRSFARAILNEKGEEDPALD